jgi:phospholipase/carboxylesterase
MSHHSELSLLLAIGCPLASAQLCVLSLHGRFGSAEDGLALGVPLAQAVLGEQWATRARVVAPTAMGNKWYPHSFLFPRSENEPQASASIARVQRTLRELRAAMPTNAKLLLMGFSQGACLTCEVLAAEARTASEAASSPRAMDCAVAFTGGLMGDDAGDAPSRMLPRAAPGSLPPVALITGDPDSHVPVQRVRETADQLRGAGAEALLAITPGKRHVVLASEIGEAGAWVRSVLKL